VKSIGEFITLVRDELGLPVTVEDAVRDFNEIPGWDSMHLLWLVAILEQQTGRSLSVIDLLDAPNLEYISKLVANE
jgi:acyl carrier protein